MDGTNFDHSEGRKSPQEDYALVPYANKNPFDDDNNMPTNPFSETSKNPFANDGLNPFEDSDLETSTNENKKPKKRSSTKNQTAAALLKFGDIEEERQLVPYGSSVENKNDPMQLLQLDDKPFNTGNKFNDKNDMKDNTSTALVVPNPFDDHQDVLNSINNDKVTEKNTIVGNLGTNNEYINSFNDENNDANKVKKDNETEGLFSDDEDEMDEEDELSVSKPISRSEEKARLSEMSELVRPHIQPNQAGASSGTMEYDDVSDDDALFSSAVEDKESRDSFTSKKRRGSQGFFGKLLSSKVGKYGSKDMYLGMDSYHGLNDFDEDTLTTCRRKRTPNEERIFRVVGPYIWEHKALFATSFFLSILVIVGQSLSLKRLRIENSNILEKLRSNAIDKNKGKSLTPSTAPPTASSMAPFDDDDFPFNLKFNVTNPINETAPSSDDDDFPFNLKFNITNPKNETNTQTPKFAPTYMPNQPSEMESSGIETNTDKKWLLPLSLCSNRNPELNYSLIGCLDGNIQDMNLVVIGASTSLSYDGSIVVVGIQTQNNDTSIFSLSSTKKDMVHNSTMNNTTRTLNDSVMNSGIGIVQIYQYQVLKNETKENTTFDFDDKIHSLQLGEWINNWEIKSNSNINHEDNETDMEINEDSFGYAVSLSGNGTRLAISSPTYKDRTGRVQIYDLIQYPMNDNGAYSFPINSEAGVTPANMSKTMVWIPMKNDVSIGEERGDLEGYDIDLSNDGTHLAIGAVGYRCDSTSNGEFGFDCGRVRVFEYSKDLDKWIQKGNDLIGKVEGNRFGTSVSLSENGNRLIVGSWNGVDATDEASNPDIYLTTYEHNSFDWIEIANSSIANIVHGNVSSITNDYHTTREPSFSFSQNGTTFAVSLGSLNKTRNSNETVSLNRVFTQTNETQMFSHLGYGIENELMRHNASNEVTNIRKQNLASISGDGRRVVFLSGLRIMNDYFLGPELNWTKMGSIQRGDYFSDASYPVTLSLSIDSSRLILVFVAMNSTMQNIISLVYDIT